MLETPLFGRFVGENKRLVFSAPVAYYHLIYACLGGGGFLAVWGFLGPLIGLNPPVYPTWSIGTGSAVFAAGVLAIWSLPIIVFDLRERIYRRRTGGGTFVRPSFGRLSDLDAVVLISEAGGLSLGVTYHLVLHWKGQKEFPLVMESATFSIPPGAPLNYAAAGMLQKGTRYAQAIGVTFYDNSHFVSTNPVPMWR